MEKIDFKKRDKALYAPSARDCAFVDVPEMSFLMIDGAGDPNAGAAYAEAVEALFSVAYTAKFMVKKRAENPVDYGVLPLEGLWWADDPSAFTAGRRDEWLWTMIIRQPDLLGEADIAAAIEAAGKKKDLPALGKLRFERFAESRAAQVMHLGPFTEEGPTIERLHAFIEASGSRFAGKHHEIYLSDIRRAAPEKWKTVLRQPVA